MSLVSQDQPHTTYPDNHLLETPTSLISMNRMLASYHNEAATAYQEMSSDDEDSLENIIEDDEIFRGLGPANSSVVASLERKKAGELANTDEVCFMCLEGWGDKEEEAKYLPCKHAFHPGCADKWFNIYHFCPLCRFELPAAKDD